MIAPLIQLLHMLAAVSLFGAAIIMSLCVIVPGIATAIRVLRNGGTR